MIVDEADVAEALLGSWPNQVAAWGKEGLAAYIRELSARGLGFDQMLYAIRTYDPDADFPPSAAKLAQHARFDPSKPTFEEAYALIYGPGGIFDVRVQGMFADMPAMERRRRELQCERCEQVHPLVGSFARRYGLDRLARLELNDPEFGELRRKELRKAWSDHLTATEGRDVAALVSGRGNGELTHLDPMAVLTGARRELQRSSTTQEEA